MTLVIAFGCSSTEASKQPESCYGVCPAGQVCDEELDECVQLSDVGRGTADLAPDFDTAWVGDAAGVVVYDQLHDRLLYGAFGPLADGELNWTSLQTGIGGFGNAPSLALVGTNSGPAIYLGQVDGLLIRGRLLESGWQWEEIATLNAPVVALDALYVPEVGHHIVAATEAVDTFFLGLQGGEVLGPEAIVDGAGDALVQPPFSLVRLAGRTTLLAGGIAGGLVSMSRESPGWTSHLMVEDVDVAAVGLHQTQVGVLALYVDRADGGLYQVIEDEVGSVVVNELAPGVRAPGNPGTPIRIALAGDSGAAYVLYHDVGSSQLRYLRGEEGWSWEEVDSMTQKTAYLPTLVTVPDAAPLAAGIDLGENAAGPGIFQLLLFGQP